MIVTRTSMSSAPLYDEIQLLNPLDSTQFCRLKVIIIQIQPINIDEGVSIINGRLVFSGILNLWSMNEVIEACISGESSVDMFGLKGITDKTQFINKINEVSKLLLNGNNWVELGLKRKTVEEKVILKIVNTILT